MWVTYVIAGLFFVAFVAMGYFGVKEHQDEARRLSAGGEPDGAEGEGTTLSRDQVVFELEHRIDEELREIDYALAAPERAQRLFET